MKVTLDFEIKVTRGTEIDRSTFKREIEPVECYTATVTTTTSGVTVDTSHITDAYSTLLLYNNDGTDDVTARLTRTYAEQSWPPGDLTLDSELAGGNFYGRFRYSTVVGTSRALGNFLQQGWEIGMYGRVSGAGQNDGSFGIANQSTLVPNFLKSGTYTFKPTPFAFSQTLQNEVTTYQQQPMDIDIQAGRFAIVDNVYPGENIVLTASANTPLVEVLIFDRQGV